MDAYSLDLRKKIVEAKERGMSTAEVAQTFGVGASTVKRYAPFNTKFAELLLAELRPIGLPRSRRASRRVRLPRIRSTGPFAVFSKENPIARRLAKPLKAPRKRKGGRLL